tara:strand:- start:52110 stop:52451 length:342 start_codon:yes stop_codon:yes gene_type:complete
MKTAIFNRIYSALLLAAIQMSNISPAYSDSIEYQNFAEHLEAISNLVDEASHSNGLWRETRNLISSAIQYAENENYTLANETLSEAEFQAKSGIQQATSQKDINKLIPAYLQR